MPRDGAARCSRCSPRPRRPSSRVAGRAGHRPGAGAGTGGTARRPGRRRTAPGLGRGSRFTVTPPGRRRAGRQRWADPAAPRCRRPGRVLVVDDNRDSADSLGAAARDVGPRGRAPSTTATTALAEAGAIPPACRAARSRDARPRRLETARRLRAADPASAMFLVAVTGWGQDRDRQQTAAAGFDAHLVKPVEHVELGALMQSGAALRRAVNPAAAPAVTGRPSARATAPASRADGPGRRPGRWPSRRGSPGCS